MAKLQLFLLALVLSWPLAASDGAGDDHRVILVTLDGVRWQEVFRGISPTMVADPTFTRAPEALAAYAGDHREDSRGRLMPFLWGTLAAEGALIGNRDEGSYMHLDNPMYFSYPGYQEILAGFADPEITSNARVNNPNITVLEWLNRRPGTRGEVAVFASWDVFPFIVNSERSGVPVNAGFDIPLNQLPTARERDLAQLLADLPGPWSTVRHDAITHHFALEYLRRARPKLLYVAYGESDDFAHDGSYDQYIDAIHRADRFIGELWAAVQSDPFYRDKTTLIVTTDHDRGEFPNAAWQHHGSREAVAGYIGQHLEDKEAYAQGIVGAGHVWLAAMGPAVKARGLLRQGGSWSATQVAATVAEILGHDYNAAQPRAGLPMVELMGTPPPGLGDRPVTRLQFGSCVHQDKPQPIWSAIVAEEADAFVFLGDNVYGDTRDPVLLAATYDRLRGTEGFEKLLRTRPVLATWDDHDYGENDAGAEYPSKEASRQLMLDFWGEPGGSERRRRDSGIYTAYNLGPPEQRVQLILLDTRWNRSPLKAVSEQAYQRERAPAAMGPYQANDDPAASLLGEAQWAWLEQRLREPARVRIIASSIQLLADFTGWESWANFPHDRQRMLKLIAEAQASGVVFVSGDTHWAELMRSPEGPYPLWEFTASGLTEEWHQVSPNRHRQGGAHVGANYGVLEIDWGQPDPLLTLAIRDQQGKEVLSQAIKLSALTIPGSESR